MTEIMGNIYLTEKEASKRYGYSSSWFQKSRYEKTGPSYIRFKNRSKIWYPITETDAWFLARMHLERE